MTESEADLRRALEEHLQFEKLLDDVSTSFVTLAPEQVDGAIVDAQRRIRWSSGGVENVEAARMPLMP